jgi:hypothetical protein
MTMSGMQRFRVWLSDSKESDATELERYTAKDAVESFLLDELNADRVEQDEEYVVYVRWPDGTIEAYESMPEVIVELNLRRATLPNKAG